jgi:lysozyme
LYFYRVPAPKKPANQTPVEAIPNPLKTVQPVRKVGSSTQPVKRTVNRKKKPKKKPFPAYLKFAAAALLLVLFSPFYYGYILKGFSSTWRWVMDISEDPNYRTYKSYDIKIPKAYNIHGIDVSSYQGKIDWKRVRDMKEDGVQVKFAIIKASEGLALVDPYFQRNWREAAKSGIICGAYHFFRPGKSGKMQARLFLQTVKFEAGDLPPVVDIETLNGATEESMRKELRDFIEHVEEKTRVKPIIYSGLTYYQDYLKGYFDGYPLWIAHYYKSDLRIDASENWFFWQHSDKAKIDGINHVVDFNAFRGDSLAFQRLLIN